MYDYYDLEPLKNSLTRKKALCCQVLSLVLGAG